MTGLRAEIELHVVVELNGDGPFVDDISVDLQRSVCRWSDGPVEPDPTKYDGNSWQGVHKFVRAMANYKLHRDPACSFFWKQFDNGLNTSLVEFGGVEEKAGAQHPRLMKLFSAPKSQKLQISTQVLSHKDVTFTFTFVGQVHRAPSESQMLEILVSGIAEKGGLFAPQSYVDEPTRESAGGDASSAVTIPLPQRFGSWVGSHPVAMIVVAASLVALVFILVRGADRTGAAPSDQPAEIPTPERSPAMIELVHVRPDSQQSVVGRLLWRKSFSLEATHEMCPALQLLDDDYYLSTPSDARILTDAKLKTRVKVTPELFQATSLTVIDENNLPLSALIELLQALHDSKDGPELLDDSVLRQNIPRLRITRKFLLELGIVSDGQLRNVLRSDLTSRALRNGYTNPDDAIYRRGCADKMTDLLLQEGTQWDWTYCMAAAFLLHFNGEADVAARFFDAAIRLSEAEAVPEKLIVAAIDVSQCLGHLPHWSPVQSELARRSFDTLRAVKRRTKNPLLRIQAIDVCLRCISGVLWRDSTPPVAADSSLKVIESLLTEGLDLVAAELKIGFPSKESLVFLSNLGGVLSDVIQEHGPSAIPPMTEWLKRAEQILQDLPVEKSHQRAAAFLNMGQLAFSLGDPQFRRFYRQAAEAAAHGGHTTLKLRIQHEEQFRVIAAMLDSSYGEDLSENQRNVMKSHGSRARATLTLLEGQNPRFDELITSQKNQWIVEYEYLARGIVSGADQTRRCWVAAIKATSNAIEHGASEEIFKTAASLHKSIPITFTRALSDSARAEGLELLSEVIKIGVKESQMDFLSGIHGRADATIRHLLPRTAQSDALTLSALRYLDALAECDTRFFEAQLSSNIASARRQLVR